MLLKCDTSVGVANTTFHNYEVKLFTSIHQTDLEWDDVCPKDDYWRSSYHKALEAARPAGLNPLYVTVWNGESWVGMAYFQYKRIDLASSLRNTGSGSRIKNTIVKTILLSWLNMDTLVLGNMLVTGKYGCHFNEAIKEDEKPDFLVWLTSWVAEWLKDRGVKIGPVLMKDFTFNQRLRFDKSHGITEFCVQPNMIFKVTPDWSGMEDYLNALKSKARIRYRRARNLLDGIVNRNLELTDLVNFAPRMHALYKSIADNAGFNLFILDENYFTELKKQLGDKLLVKGYFDRDGNLVGFFTGIKNFDHLDAHFLGYEVEFNKVHQLYLNMLFDMINEGLELGVKKIFMSRTAVEIKSSVGADAVDIYCYLHHRNSYLNRLVPAIVSGLYQKEEWQPRSPFK